MRQKANLIINEIVQLFLETCPDLRYIQALYALDIITSEADLENDTIWAVDRFYEEPVDTLKRCEQKILAFFCMCPQSTKCADLLQRMQEVCNS